MRSDFVPYQFRMGLRGQDLSEPHGVNPGKVVRIPYYLDDFYTLKRVPYQEPYQTLPAITKPTGWGGRSLWKVPPGKWRSG